jgi:hypothetical protein
MQESTIIQKLPILRILVLKASKPWMNSILFTENTANNIRKYKAVFLKVLLAKCL